MTIDELAGGADQILVVGGDADIDPLANAACRERRRSCAAPSRSPSRRRCAARCRCPCTGARCHPLPAERRCRRGCGAYRTGRRRPGCRAAAAARGRCASVASVVVRSSMSIRTKLPWRAAAAAMRSTLSRQNPSSISRPSMVSLMETLESSPRSAISSNSRTYSTTAASALDRSVTSSPSRSRVATAPLGVEPTDDFERLLAALSGDVALRHPADDELRDHRQGEEDQAAEQAHPDPTRSCGWRSAAHATMPLSLAAPAPDSGASATQRTDFEHGQTPPTRRRPGIADTASRSVASPLASFCACST